MADNEAEIIYAKLAEERKTGELLQLPGDFYKKAEIIATKENEQTKSNNDKLLNTLKAKRIQKLLIYIAYDRQLPQNIPEEEKTLYKRIKGVLEDSEGHEVSARIRILADIPEIATSYGGKIGPYKANEEVEVDDEEAEFILKNNIGKRI